MTIKTKSFDAHHIMTYSDSGRYVIRDGVQYRSAVDPIGSGRVYSEGDLIPPDPERGD